MKLVILESILNRWKKDSTRLEKDLIAATAIKNYLYAGCIKIKLKRLGECISDLERGIDEIET